MALRELNHERRPRTRVDNALYSGWAYHRRYECPTESLETDVATLTIGRVLPAAEGGVATTNVGDPRLASLKIDEKASGLITYLDATYVQIDVSGTADTYNVTTKSGKVTTSQHETVKEVIGIATTTTDAHIPARGETDLEAAAALLSDYVCRDCQVIDKWQAGRVLVLATFAKPVAEGTTYT